MNQPFPFLFLSLSPLLFSIILRNRLLKIESSTLSLSLHIACEFPRREENVWATSGYDLAMSKFRIPPHRGGGAVRVCHGVALRNSLN